MLSVEIENMLMCLSSLCAVVAVNLGPEYPLLSSCACGNKITVFIFQ